jgi:NADPH:quinone reductase-like Zn-dependent oxidoreductase
VAHLRRALAPKGSVVFIGGEGGGRWFGDMGRTLQAAAMSPFVGQRMGGMFARTRKDDLETLRELIEAGKVKPVIDRTYTLSDAPEAVRALEKSLIRGKAIISI